MRRLDLWVEPEVLKAQRKLPGHVRQRVRCVITSLAEEPRPHASQALDVADLDVPPGVEFRRLRLEWWRLVYAVNEAAGWVWILGLHRRPPYDYEDLGDLAILVSE